VSEEIWATLEFAIRVNPLLAAKLAHLKVGGADEVKGGPWVAENELGAEFDWLAVREVRGPHASANAIARFKNKNTQTSFGDQTRCRQASHSRAYDYDISRFIRHIDKIRESASNAAVQVADLA
jgi:hypothetical protein